MALNGTPAADTLSARFDRDAVYGFGGRDVLSSSGYNDTYLDGGADSDRLTSSFDLALLPHLDRGPPGPDPERRGRERCALGVPVRGRRQHERHDTGCAPQPDRRGRDRRGRRDDRRQYHVFQPGDFDLGRGGGRLAVGRREQRGDVVLPYEADDPGWRGNDQVTIRTYGAFPHVANTVYGEGGNDTIFADAVGYTFDSVTEASANNQISGGTAMT